jgi:pimeloyl-ACP methyl ester carboxylesterase
MALYIPARTLELSVIQAIYCNMTQVQLNTIKVDGVNVFYRSAGPPTAPVLLLLHGFPASSFQFRELIPLLASKFRVLAPDLPAFGFTEVPAERNYQYTFDSLSVTIEAFLDSLKVGKFAVYIFDYGVRTLSLFPNQTHHRMADSNADSNPPQIYCSPRRHSVLP